MEICYIVAETLRLISVILLILGNSAIHRQADTFAKIIMRNNIELTKEEWKSVCEEKTDYESSKLIKKWNNR